MSALPLIDALVPPGVGLLLAVLLPFATARLLAFAYLSDLPEAGEERRRRLVPFRRAALLVGLSQIQLLWTLGVTRVGPTLVETRGGAYSLAFGALLATITFLAGGVARRVEEPPATRRGAMSAIMLRLRIVPLAAAPIGVAIATTQLPLLVFDTGHAELSYVYATLAFALCFVAVAFAGLAASLLTRALLPAGDALAARVKRAAAKEGIARVLALKLPTGDARFINATAFPWARTVVVSEAAEAMLEPAELDAVLSHEAAHLSEGPAVSLARLTAPTLLLFAIIPGLSIAFGLGFDRSGPAFAGLILLAAFLYRQSRRLARRMEVRADAHAAENAGGSNLAGALRKIAEVSQRPMLAGGARVHPGLWDRLVALGDDPGSRPPAMSKTAGFVFGLGLFAALLAGPIALTVVTDVPASSIHTLSVSAAKGRLYIDPWDGEAMLALGWRAREDGAVDIARARALCAGRMGADPQSFYLLLAEISAAEGDCDAARDAFEDSLAAEAAAAFDDPFGSLSLGNYTLPPTLVTDCDMTVGDIFGADAIDEDGNVVLGGRPER